MSKTLRVLGIGLLVLFALVGLAILLVFYTPPGRHFVKTQAEQQIANAVNGRATIGALAPGLPGYLRLDDVVIDDANGSQRPLLTAERLVVSWDPLALLGGRVKVKTISLQTVLLDRLPVANSDAQDTSGEPIALPDSLPSVTVDNITINQLTVGEAVVGEDITLSVAGDLRMRGRSLAANLTASSDNDLDQLRLATDIDLERKRFAVDATISGAAEGVISSLTGAQGPVNLIIKGREENRTALVDVNGDLGTLGTANFALTGPIKSGATITLDGTVTPGAQFADLQGFTGETITLSLAATPKNKGATLAIKSLATQAASASGEVSWANNQDLLANFETALTLALDKSQFADLTDALGQEFTINAALNAQNDRASSLYDLAATLTSAGATITVVDAQTNLSSQLRGQLSGDVAVRDFLPEAIRSEVSSALTFSGVIDANSAAATTLSDFSFAAGNAITGTVNGVFDTQTQRVDGAFKTDLAPGLFAKLLGAESATARATLRSAVEGTAEAFTLNTELQSPAFQHAGRSYPAITMDAKLSGLPTLPTGTVFARPQGQTQDTATQFLRARLESTDTLIALRDLQYIGTGFELTGASLIDPESQSLAVDLAYAGIPGAQPFPGFTLAGSVTAQGGFGSAVPAGLETAQRDGILVEAEHLTIDYLTVEGLAASLAGTVNDARFDLALSDLLNDGTPIVTDSTLKGTLTGDTENRVVISTLTSKLLGEVSVRTISPFTVEMGETNRLSGVDLQWGRAGSLAMDGAFSPARWQGTIAIKNALIPTTDGYLDLNMTLDTQAQTPATGSLTTDYRHSTGDDDEETPPTRLSAALDWDGTRLRLADRQGTGTIPLDFSLDLPARLVRAPALSVKTDGVLAGRVKYEGAVAPLTATIPGPAQGLDGQLRIDLTLDGPTNQPAVNGVITLADGAYTDLTTGLSLIGLHLETTAQSSANRSEIAFTGGGRGDGQEGEDRFTVNGTMALGEESRITTDIKIRDLIVSATPVTSLQQSGDIRIDGPVGALAVKGGLDITEMNVEIITPPQTGLVPIEVIKKSVYEAVQTAQGQPLDLTRASADPEQLETQAANGLAALNLAITADDRLFVRGRGLESEWESDLAITLVDQEPVALGTIGLRKGTFDFTGRRFDVTTGEIIFDKLSPNDPVINIIAEYQTDDGLVAQVRASGRSSDVKVELTSNPVRPANDVMALILFGKPADQLSALESVQTAQALATLGGIGPFGGTDAIGSIRSAAGLDLLNLDLDPENGASALTVGKYVADGLFVSATQDVEGKNGSVRIEYEIRDNITVESNVRQDGNQTVSANWKKDF